MNMFIDLSHHSTNTTHQYNLAPIISEITIIIIFVNGKWPIENRWFERWFTSKQLYNYGNCLQKKTILPKKRSQNNCDFR